MENPDTWGPAEKAVRKVLDEARNVLPEYRCGLSLERRITNALRDIGALKESNGKAEEEKDRRPRPYPPDHEDRGTPEPEVRDGTLV